MWALHRQVEVKGHANTLAQIIPNKQHIWLNIIRNDHVFQRWPSLHSNRSTWCIQCNKSVASSCCCCCLRLGFATLPPCQRALIMPGLWSHFLKKQPNFSPNTPEKTWFLKHSKPPNQMCSRRKRSPTNKGVTEQRMLWTVIITSQRGGLISPDSFGFGDVGFESPCARKYIKHEPCKSKHN